MQETFEAGTKLLPRSSLDSLMRLALRSTSAACMRAFGQDGVRGYNLYAVEKLATNMATMERFASRCVAWAACEAAGPAACVLRTAATHTRVRVPVAAALLQVGRGVAR